MASPRNAAGFSTGSIRISVHTSFSELAEAWDGLAAQGLATPYQNRRWVEAYARTVGEDAGEKTLAVLCLGADGAPLMLLPLAIRASVGVRIARMVGGKHANFHMPLFAQDAGKHLTPACLTEALAQAADDARIDLVAFENVPVEWHGTPNPLVRLGGRPGASQGYKIALEADDEAVARRILSKDSRKKLRKKREHLAELGPLHFGRIETDAACDAALETFFRLKAERFAALGIPDPFADAAVQTFIRQACHEGLADGAPVIALYALRAGERLLAMMGGVQDARRFSGMFNVFDPAPEVARWSPGDNLLLDLTRELCRSGLETFDLGIGEAHYKRVFCDGVEHVVDLALPITARGRIYAIGLMGAAEAKRRIKSSELLQKTLSRVRRAASAG